MKSRFFIGSLIVVLFFSIYVFYQSYAFTFFLKDQQVIKLVLKKNFFAPIQKEITVEVAKTPTSTSKGLSNRLEMKTLKKQNIDGLLFIFPKKETRHFWMKDMLFEIDICWLDRLSFFSCERKVSLSQSDQKTQVYSSLLPFDMVLETEPGFISDEELQLKLFFKW